MRMRYTAFQILKLRTRAARVIANWYHRAINRIKSFLDGTDMISCVRKLKRQLFLMMRVVRGFLGREKAARMRIVLATRTFAATLIQRIYRGSRVLHWRDMRMNVIAAYILDRHNIERDDRVYDSRITYHRFIVDNRKDSASEDDETLFEVTSLLSPRLTAYLLTFAHLFFLPCLLFKIIPLYTPLSHAAIFSPLLSLH